MEVLKPLAKATRTGALGLPIDGIVESDHLLATGCSANEPAIERIVENRLIGTPAVGVVMGMLLDAECFVLHLKHDTDVYDEALFVVNRLGRVGVLYISPGIYIVEGEVYSRGQTP